MASKRVELSEGAMGAFLPFVNQELLPVPARPRESSQRVAAAEGHQRGRLGGRQGRRGHRAEPARHPRSGRRHPPRGGRPDAPLHAEPGLRGPAAEDGREEQRRRPVLHAARGHPGDGPRDRPEGRRDGLRPGLRHRRLPRPGVRVDARAAWVRARRPTSCGRSARTRSGAARRRTSSTRSRSPTSSSTASTSRTSGTATR